jgi:hypothetical protein
MFYWLDSSNSYIRELFKDPSSGISSLDTKIESWLSSSWNWLTTEILSLHTIDLLWIVIPVITGVVIFSLRTNGTKYLRIEAPHRRDDDSIDWLGDSFDWHPLGDSIDWHPVRSDDGSYQGVGERSRFTDLTLYEGHLFHGDDATSRRRLPDEEALRIDRKYTLEVAIRSKRIGLSAPLAPSAILNPRQSTEPLTIFVVVRPKVGPIIIEDPVGVIEWPYDQDSTRGFFRLTMPQRLQEAILECKFEVRLYHENLDLLDVVQLVTHVTADVDLVGFGSLVSWPRGQDSAFRLDPDAAIRKLTVHVSSDSEGFQFELIFRRGEKNITLPFRRNITAGDLESLLEKVRNFWTELAITNYEQKLSVSLPTWKRYLESIRNLGSEAWQLLFGSRTGSQKGTPETIGELLERMSFLEGTHIQITYDRRITEFVFPWNILYPPWKTGAEVDLDAFWGARYQIEQVWEGGERDNLQSEPVGIAAVIDPHFDSFGESTAEIQMLKDFCTSAGGRISIDFNINGEIQLLHALSNRPAHHLYYFFCHGYAPSRQSLVGRDGVKLLRETIEKLSPETQAPWSTLLALTAKMNNEAWMFIGNSEVKESTLRRTGSYFDGRRPIVFMNMCHSAALAPSMTSGLVRLFLDRDASAVIGTESPMTSVFAHAFAHEFLTHLLAGTDGTDVGTALWRARRFFLHNKMNPLGLSYTLYGRATVGLGSKRTKAPEESHNG